jgi:hypothetical protein
MPSLIKRPWQQFGCGLGVLQRMPDSAAGLPVASLTLIYYCRCVDRSTLFAACALLVSAGVQDNLIQHSLTPHRR